MRLPNLAITSNSNECSLFIQKTEVERYIRITVKYNSYHDKEAEKKAHNHKREEITKRHSRAIWKFRCVDTQITLLKDLSLTFTRPQPSEGRVGDSVPKSLNVYELVVKKFSIQILDKGITKLLGNRSKVSRSKDSFIPDYQIIKIKPLLRNNGKGYFILINITCGISFSMWLFFICVFSFFLVAFKAEICFILFWLYN